MEKNRYITYNEELFSKLQSIGFSRKRGNSYVKTKRVIKYELSFSHSTHNEPHVKYYTITLSIEYQKVQEIVDKMNVVIGGFGINLGYLLPEFSFKEWKVTETSSDEYISFVVGDMYTNIVNFAIPYFERYSEIRNVIEDIEKGVLKNQIDSSHYLPILYLLNGDKDLVVPYLQKELNRREYLKNKVCGDDYPFPLFNNVKDCSTSESRIYNEYKSFVDKIMRYMSECGFEIGSRGWFSDQG